MINSKWCKRLNKKINWAQHEEGRNMDGQAIWIYCNFLFAQQQQLQNRSSNNSIDRSQPEEDQQQPINILLINIQPGMALLLSPSAWRSPYVASRARQFNNYNQIEIPQSSGMCTWWQNYYLYNDSGGTGPEIISGDRQLLVLGKEFQLLLLLLRLLLLMDFPCSDNR